MTATTGHGADYITVPQLKHRGWTDALIRKHLGEPDATRPNPYYRSATPVRLYRHERVAAVEESEQSPRVQDASPARRGAARAAATNRDALLAELNGVTLAVPLMPVAQVTRRACEDYNRRQESGALRKEFWDRQEADAASDPAFLMRISVNYLRHQMSEYEAVLADVSGRVGCRHAYAEINRKVYAAIAAAYPTLSGECSRQLAVKLDRMAVFAQRLET